MKAFVILAPGFEGTPELAEELALPSRSSFPPMPIRGRSTLVAELPKTPSGKIQRFLLRKAEIEKQQQQN